MMGRLGAAVLVAVWLLVTKVVLSTSGDNV